MFVVWCSLLCVVRCLLHIVSYSFFVGRCFVVVCCLLFVRCLLLFAVSCLSSVFADRCSLFVVSCSLVVVYCFLSAE